MIPNVYPLGIEPRAAQKLLAVGLQLILAKEAVLTVGMALELALFTDAKLDVSKL